MIIFYERKIEFGTQQHIYCLVYFIMIWQVHIPEDLRSLVRVRCRQVQRDTMPISLPIIKEVSACTSNAQSLGLLGDQRITHRASKLDLYVKISFSNKINIYRNITLKFVINNVMSSQFCQCAQPRYIKTVYNVWLKSMIIF